MGVTVEVIERGFNKQNLSEYELSILVGVDSFSYMLKDAENRVQALKEYQFDLELEQDTWEELIAEETLLKEKFKKIHLGVSPSPFAFIPKDLFDRKKTREYLNHLTELKKDDEVKASLIPEAQAYNLFVLPSWMKKRLADLPKTRKTMHLSSILLKKAKEDAERSDQPFLWAHIGKTRIWLGALENSELKYANSFAFETENDALYYLLLLFDHTGLAPDRTTIHLSGKIDKDWGLFKNLIRFVAQPEFMGRPEKLVFGPQLDEYPPHWFYDLLSLQN